MTMAVSALFLALLALSSHCGHAEKFPPLACSLNENEGVDPALKEMKFDVGDGPETFLAYVQPDVKTFYKDGAPSSTAVTPKHNGLGGLFINLSNKDVMLSWEPYIGGAKSLIDYLGPFDSGGTATFPSHSFLITSEDKPDVVLKRFKVGTYPENVYVYDPYHVEGDEEQTKENLKALNEKELQNYRMLRKSVLFGEEYKKFTGRSYLVNYPRSPPTHHMWRADYFNQTHWITTRETHFESLPPPAMTGKIKVHGKARKLSDDEPRVLHEYRSKDPIMNLTLKVVSCAPRVFEIQNFLSPIEVAHILDLAAKENLARSSTGTGGDDEDDIRRTRTSYNSWVERERSPIIDSIYRRAGDLLRIDEALLRHRGDGEYPDLGTHKTIAESLQLVHYDPDQEYTAHHDFGYSRVDDPFQAQRFATLLLYLNEGMTGGETSFPRWQNAETFEELKVVPEVGKAVLFYSQLPDGNMDDFSQHEAKKVRDGEKWLINLWVWGPVYEK